MMKSDNAPCFDNSALLLRPNARATSGAPWLLCNPQRLNPQDGFTAIAPAVVAATAFAFADVSTKVTLHAEADVLTMALSRGMIGVPLLLLWLYGRRRRRSR